MKTQDSLIDKTLIVHHLYASMVYLGIVLLVGFIYSLQFLNLYPFPNIELLSPGRIRMSHTMGAAYGMIANGLYALVLYMIPKLTGTQVYSKKLGTAVFWIYNALVVSTVVLIQMGFGQGLEWAETPAVLDPFIAVTVVAMNVNILIPIFKNRHKVQYVSVWYILASLVWTPLVYVMGNFLPQYVFPGTGGAAISSMYIHDLVGLFVTPIGIAGVYYLLPVLLDKPLYSHSLSMIGFWGLAIFYPLNSVHHYLYSPIPMWAQYASVVTSVGMHVVVYTVIFNVFATMANDWPKVFSSHPLRFIFVGACVYLATCIQCAIQVTLSVQAIVHFTDWVVGHSHMIMFGTFGFWIFAWTYHLIPKLTGKKIYSSSLASWHFWLSTAGILLMAVDLAIAGLVQGQMWRSLVPFVDSIKASMPYWWIRTFSGTAIIMGVGCYFWNMYKTAQQPQTLEQRV